MAVQPIISRERPGIGGKVLAELPAQRGDESEDSAKDERAGRVVQKQYSHDEHERGVMTPERYRPTGPYRPLRFPFAILFKQHITDLTCNFSYRILNSPSGAS